MYKLRVLKSAQKDMKKIRDKELLYRIHHSLMSLKYNPYTGKKLKGYESLYRIRVANFRVIYTIDEDNKTIYVVLIDKRSKVYKRL